MIYSLHVALAGLLCAALVSPGLAQVPASNPAPAGQNADLRYIGDTGQIGIGLDTRGHARADGLYVFGEKATSSWIGQFWAAERGAGGLQLSHHWLPADASPDTGVRKLFGAIDQNAQRDRKVTAGAGYETSRWFGAAYASAGITGRRALGETAFSSSTTVSGSDTQGLFEQDVTTTTLTRTFERAYDWGLGVRAGHFYGGPLLRLQVGADYEWGRSAAHQTTLSVGVEKFFAGSPHSLALVGEAFRKSDDEASRSDSRAYLMYRYSFDGPAYRPERSSPMVRGEAPPAAAPASTAGSAAANAGTVPAAGSTAGAVPGARSAGGTPGLHAGTTAGSATAPAATGAAGAPAAAPMATPAPMPLASASPASSDAASSAGASTATAKPAGMVVPRDAPSPAAGGTPAAVTSGATPAPAPRIEKRIIKTTATARADAFFDFDRAVLRPEARAALDIVAVRLIASGFEGNIRIVGHTCNIGTPQYNQKLSERRARAVRDYLVKAGLPADRMLAEGMGLRNPRYPNDAEGRPKNRRVDIEFITYEDKVQEVTLPPLLVPAPASAGPTTPGPAEPRSAASGGTASPAGVPGPGSAMPIASGAAPAATAPSGAGTIPAPGAGQTMPGTHGAPAGAGMAPASSGAGTPGVASASPLGTAPSAGAAAAAPAQSPLVEWRREEIAAEPAWLRRALRNPVQHKKSVDVYRTTERRTVTTTGDKRYIERPPLAQNDSFTVARDSTGNLFDVLANDRDPEGKALAIVAVATAAHGSATVSGNRISYTPAAGYSGPDSFGYTVADAAGLMASATVTVTVTPGSTSCAAPVAVTDSIVTAYNTPEYVSVLANDRDPAGLPLTVTSVTQPAHGIAALGANNTVVYQATIGYIGPDAFAYTITNSCGASATGTVSVYADP